MKKDFLEAGKIVNTHGVRGDFKMESWCDAPEVFELLPAVYLKQGNAYLPKKLTRVSLFKGMVIGHFEGVDSFEEANRLKNTVVYAKREDVPLAEGAAFLADLIGLPVIDADSGRVYGEIVDIQEGAASDLYEIRTENGIVLFPAVDEFIDRMDVDTGVYIRPIGGFFDAL